jgi:hypothetical protein
MQHLGDGAEGPRRRSLKFGVCRKRLRKLFDSATDEVFAAPQQTCPPVGYL